MNIKSSEKKENSLAEIIIEVGAEELESAIGKAYVKNRNRIAVPGFRKGKAPRKIIEKMYGESVFHSDALDALIPDALKALADGTDLKIVGYPQVTDADFAEGNKGVDITITATLYPEITLGEYKGLSAVKPAAEVADEEIDSEIAGMRLRNASIEKTDRPAINGDTAIIDFEGFLDGEPFENGSGNNFELKLGSNTFIPGFEEKMHGMSVGEERDLDLVFPDNYAGHLAGKAVVFKVKLLELKEEILPDLDDEFAKDVSEFDTLEEYRADIRDKLMKARESEADIAFENALMDKVVESFEADLPASMVEEQMDIGMNNFATQVSGYGMDPSSYLQMMNTTPDVFRENMRKSSEKQVKIMLALEKIAELENIEVSAEEIEKEYEEGAKRYSMEVDKLKESVSESMITRDIKIRLAARVVTENAIAEDPPEEPPEKAGAEAAEADAAEEGKPKEKAVAGQSKPAQKKAPASKKTTASAAGKDGGKKTAGTAAKKPADGGVDTADGGAPTTDDEAPAVKSPADNPADNAGAPDVKDAEKPKKPAARKPKAAATPSGEE